MRYLLTTRLVREHFGNLGYHTLHHAQGGELQWEENAVSDDSWVTAAPRLDRLMSLRDALVALKGPLADNAMLQRNLQRQLFNEASDTRVLGRIGNPLAEQARRIPFGEPS